MTKEEYLQVLEKKLKRLPEEEVDAAIDYYSEYFEEAGAENIDEVIAKLGSPSQVASQILADYATKSLDEHPESTKKGISAIWFIILAILAAPIALPLLLLLILPIFIVLVITGAFTFSFFAIVFSLIISGIFLVISGFSVLTDHFATSTFFIGSGLAVSGIGILLFSPVLSISNKAFKAIALWMKKLYVKISKKGKGGNF